MPPRSLLLAALLLPSCASSQTWTLAPASLPLPLNLRPANEGVSHDATHWYFSNQHVLYKTTKSPITVELAVPSIPSELRQLRYDHIGDIDVDAVAGVLYAGLESSQDGQHGILAAYNTTDLSLLRYSLTSQAGAPWVAVDYGSRKLYSHDWGDVGHLQTYDLDTFDFVETVECTLPSEVQGAAFFGGELFVSSNVDVSVWRIDIVGEEKPVAVRVVSQPERKVLEMEGLTFWADDELKELGLGEMFFYGNFMTQKNLISYKLGEEDGR